WLNRAASPEKGRIVYTNYCVKCHGSNGEGLLSKDAAGFVYPPLWGTQTFNVSAGMYRISLLAGFIKNNMPFGINWKKPVLTNEEAWDVAAFINSQPRPKKFFSYDWKNVSKKPIDYPFGPYADTLS